MKKYTNKKDASAENKNHTSIPTSFFNLPSTNLWDRVQRWSRREGWDNLNCDLLWISIPYTKTECLHILRQSWRKKDVGMDVWFLFSAEASFLLVYFFIIYTIPTSPFFWRNDFSTCIIYVRRHDILACSTALEKRDVEHYMTTNSRW